METSIICEFFLVFFFFWFFAVKFMEYCVFEFTNCPLETSPKGAKLLLLLLLLLLWNQPRLIPNGWVTGRRLMEKESTMDAWHYEEDDRGRKRASCRVRNRAVETQHSGDYSGQKLDLLLLKNPEFGRIKISCVIVSNDDNESECVLTE
jgi:hypothetical protein